MKIGRTDAAKSPVATSHAQPQSHPSGQPPAHAPSKRFTLVGGEGSPPAAPPAPTGPLSPTGPTGPLGPPSAKGRADGERGAAAKTLTRILENERQVDEGLKAAMNGQKLSAPELIVLQAKVMQYSQELEVVARVVDKASAAVKQTLQTQV